MPFKVREDRKQLILADMIDNYISEDNEVRVIDAYVDSLDIKELGFKRTEAAHTGRAAYRPQDMIKLYLYGYMNNVRSSRQLERECKTDLEVMWLLCKQTPDHKTIADFRKENKNALVNVNTEFVLFCKGCNLFSNKLIAIDGTKIRASNSKKNIYTDKKLTWHINYIEDKIKEYMQFIDETDKKENDNKNNGKSTKDEIEKSIKKLEERKLKHEKMKEQIAEGPEKEISTVDPDARLMVSSNKGIDSGYNLQAVVDSKYNLVASFDVINNASDSGQLYRMASKAKEVLGVDEITALADKGYSNNHKDLIDCDNDKITVYAALQKQPSIDEEGKYSANKFKYDEENDCYICPQGQTLYFHRTRKEKELEYRDYTNYRACENCPARDKCTKSKKGRVISRSEAAKVIENMINRMQENIELYKLRQMIVEPVFGTIKRAMGFTYFLLRGLEGVIAEAALILCAYNMRRAIKIMGVNEMIKKIRAI